VPVSPVKQSGRLTRSSGIIKSILEAIHDKKGEMVVSLDLKSIPEAVADFFIICQASSTIQVKAIAEHVGDVVWGKCAQRPFHEEGLRSMQWVIVDYVDVVVHVFLPETRGFYRLEEMWSDAGREEHADTAVSSPLQGGLRRKTTSTIQRKGRKHNV